MKFSSIAVNVANASLVSSMLTRVCTQHHYYNTNWKIVCTSVCAYCIYVCLSVFIYFFVIIISSCFTKFPLYFHQIFAPLDLLSLSFSLCVCVCEQNENKLYRMNISVWHWQHRSCKTRITDFNVYNALNAMLLYFDVVVSVRFSKISFK